MDLGVLVLALTLGVLASLLLVWFWRRRSEKDFIGPAPDLPPLIKVDDTHIYIKRRGVGPSLVLIHGIGASSFTWRLVEEELSKSFDVINIDLPGFGRSEKNPEADYSLDAQTRRLLTLLDHLNVKKAYLMGSSMGGALALWLARLQPERFPKVLALAPATSPERIKLSWRQVRWLLPLAPKFYSQSLMSRLYRRTVTNSELLTAETLKGYHLPFTDPAAVITFLKATELLADPRLPAELAHIQSQVCIAYGTEDKLVHKKDIERLHQTLSHSTLHIRSGGHHLHEDDPAWVLKLAQEFFL